MKLGLIIVTYHHNDITLKNILNAVDGLEVIVVNNDNSETSAAVKYFLQKNKVNIGYGPSVDEGIKILFEKNVNWFVILNQDLQISKEAVIELIDTLRKKPPSIVGPFGGSIDKKRWTTILPSDGSVDYISGSCMAIHKDVIEKIGYFYEPYFMYYEDVDFCIRAKRAGFPIIHLPIKGIIHDEKQSVKNGTPDREYYLARNHLLFVERLAPILVKAHELLRLQKTYYEHIEKKEYGAAAGLRDYFRRRFGKRT